MTHPCGHVVGVRVPVVVVEHQHSQQHAARHHAHDEVEVSPWKNIFWGLISNDCFWPIKGTASLVIGISSETMFMKTVKESITVTPGDEWMWDLHFIFHEMEIIFLHVLRSKKVFHQEEFLIKEPILLASCRHNSTIMIFNFVLFSS